MAKLLVKVGFGFYGTNTWRDRVLGGADPVLVGFDEANAHLPEALWLFRSFPRARVAFRTNGQVAQAAAPKADAGIALLPHFIGRHEPDLVACRLEHAPPPRKVWLITRRHGRKDAAIRTVADFVVQSFENERSRFEGPPDEALEKSGGRGGRNASGWRKAKPRQLATIRQAKAVSAAETARCLADSPTRTGSSAHRHIYIDRHINKVGHPPRRLVPAGTAAADRDHWIASRFAFAQPR